MGTGIAYAVSLTNYGAKEKLPALQSENGSSFHGVINFIDTILDENADLLHRILWLTIGFGVETAIARDGMSRDQVLQNGVSIVHLSVLSSLS